jgi:hypothetical protein
LRVPLCVAIDYVVRFFCNGQIRQCQIVVPVRRPGVVLSCPSV